MEMSVRRSLILASIGYTLFFAPQHVLAAADPIMWLKFDDGSGTTPQDSSANNIDGSFTATQPTWSAVAPDVAFSNPYSLSFTGTNDGVSITWPADQNFGETDPRSFSFWYKPTANGEGAYSRLLSWSNDKLEIAGTENGGSTHKITYYDGTWHATDITLSIGTWYHVTFTYDGTTAKFYIGDELQDEHSLAGRSLSGTLMIGNRVQDGNEGINGNIDDVRVYDYALNSSQVANLAAGSDDPDSAPDETAPTLSSVTSSSLTSSGATITWTTNEAASTKVAYSADGNYASSTTETDTSTRVTSHSQALTSLLSCTVYNYKVVSRDAAGNAATSTASTFTTTGCAGGVTPIGSNSTDITVSSAATTTMSASSRLLEVVTPANFTATSSTIVLQIKGLTASTVLDSIGKPSSSLSSAASVVFDVKALINNVTELDSFDTPVTITYTYTSSDASGLDESTLSMYHYADSTWSELDDCSVDTSANTVTCEAPHFSVFAIFGTAASSSSGSNSSGGGAALPWCSGPHAPGWNTSLPGGGCGAQVAAAPLLAWHLSCHRPTFSRTLRFGMLGEDVRNLQKLMNCLGFTVAESGPGAPGEETSLFVDRTRAAVIKFQETYKDDILVPIGEIKGTGIFGYYSRTKVRDLTAK